MTEIKYMCDRCGDVIMIDRCLLKVECGTIRPHMQAIDLCQSCTDMFASFLRQSELDAVMAEPATEPFVTTATTSGV
jgi:hypothetical protein